MRIVSQLSNALYMVDEPGDGTHYEFIIAEKDSTSLWIASVGGVRFDGYSYRRDSVEAYVKERPALVTGAYDYEKAVRDWPGDSACDGFIAYIVEHSQCNPWTALSAIRCLSIAHSKMSISCE